MAQWKVAFLAVNYFDWFALPLRYELDLTELKRKYYQKSRTLHPDRHTLADAELQADMLQQASYNNEAYKTLSDPERRLYYLLAHFEKLAPEGENSVPQAFLMEMMDFNEALMELQVDYSGGQAEALADQIQAYSQSLLEDLQALLAAPDFSKLNEAEWAAIGDLYLKQKYLSRLREQMSALEP